ncbi:hypothetical protein EG835_14615, partial [bacterium]|nr:hypothetical protein [bacterium]
MTSITRAAGKLSLAGACMLVFLFAFGCTRPSGRMQARVTPIATPIAAPTPSAGDIETTTTTGAGGEMRAANPESLGE